MHGMACEGARALKRGRGLTESKLLSGAARAHCRWQRQQRRAGPHEAARVTAYIRTTRRDVSHSHMCPLCFAGRRHHAGGRAAA